MKKCGGNRRLQSQGDGRLSAAISEKYNGMNHGMKEEESAGHFTGTFCGGKVQEPCEQTAKLYDCEVYKKVKAEESTGFKLMPWFLKMSAIITLLAALLYYRLSVCRQYTSASRSCQETNAGPQFSSPLLRNATFPTSISSPNRHSAPFSHAFRMHSFVKYIYRTVLRISGELFLISFSAAKPRLKATAKKAWVRKRQHNKYLQEILVSQERIITIFRHPTIFRILFTTLAFQYLNYI